jgi:serine/threonine protein kinase
MVAYLWEHEVDTLKLGMLGVLPKWEANKAATRAAARFKTNTKSFLRASGFSFGKVLFSSGRDSAIYAAFKGTTLLVAKVYTSEGKLSFDREVKAHETVGGHARIAPLVHVARFDGQKRVGLLIFPRYVSSLSDSMTDFGVLSNSAAFDIAKDLLEALAHMHSHNMVHCDVKPANVMLDERGRGVLIDLASSVPKGHAVVECTSRYALGLHQGEASFALDCRCVAVSVFQLLTARIPISLEQMMDELGQMEGTAAALALRCANAVSTDVASRSTDTPSGSDQSGES